MEGFGARKALVLNPLDLGVEVVGQALATDERFDPSP
jgi:hypothetical protein